MNLKEIEENKDMSWSEAVDACDWLVSKVKELKNDHAKYVSDWIVKWGELCEENDARLIELNKCRAALKVADDGLAKLEFYNQDILLATSRIRQNIEEILGEE